MGDDHPACLDGFDGRKGSFSFLAVAGRFFFCKVHGGRVRRETSKTCKAEDV